ncbi:arginine--tRNA ligase [Parvularcula lutaonensis]|uniref:Arginine--tRNA ligase n=1 Tax=Parvularcula lutaonensis TaxID=491923 RepID=A0ABV7M8A3_9PROT|nr:arginine--tRNA ligase [Parvularcula lutaonensis]GGY44210.1 arginine--tRNA ligase [Parvularcula lutaonensis]
MISLTERLSRIVGDAFEAEGLDRALGAVRVSDRPDLAPFQCNGALAAAKAAKKNPRQLADAIKARLDGDAAFEEVTLAGPGFLNLTPTVAFVEELASELKADEQQGCFRVEKAEKVVLDYGGPNVAKPLHVGHLRSAIIGEALKRIMRRAGDDALGDIHLGDWGLQMGQLIAELRRRMPDLPYFDENKTDGFPEESPVTVEELAEIYPAASAACKADPERMAEAQAATAELQAGRPGYRALWQHFVNVSREALERDYGALGVSFELWRGEASVHDLIEPMVAELKERGLLEESDGAQVVFVAREDDKKGIPPLLVVKSNGSVGYGSTDLATLVQRKQDGFERAIYVVDKRQSEHFVQVFRAAVKMGLFEEDQLEHAAFGTMNGKDGKPFKTREGGVLKLSDLIAMVTEKAEERLRENSGDGADDPSRADNARMVGIAALKFADLSNPRTTDYVFDIDRFVAFEGKTGPYLLYAAVRMRSVLRKAGVPFDEAMTGTFCLKEQAEVDLATSLLGYGDAHRSAYEKRMPHILCEHAFQTAQAFSKFYANCRIADEQDPDIRRSRLALVAVTLRQIEDILGQLGIQIPQEM